MISAKRTCVSVTGDSRWHWRDEWTILKIVTNNSTERRSVRSMTSKNSSHRVVERWRHSLSSTYYVLHKRSFIIFVLQSTGTRGLLLRWTHSGQLFQLMTIRASRSLKETFPCFSCSFNVQSLLNKFHLTIAHEEQFVYDDESTWSHCDGAVAHSQASQSQWSTWLGLGI